VIRTMANEEISLQIETVRNRLEQLDKESLELTELVRKLRHIKDNLVSTQAEVQQNRIETETRLQEIETKWTQALKEMETIILGVEEKTKGFEEEGKKKPNVESSHGVLWIGIVMALLLSLISLGIKLWEIYGTFTFPFFKVP
jgi:hypothetical protein